MTVDMVTITEVEGGAEVAFPYDRDLIAGLRRLFPRACWDRARRVWHIPGKTAGHRVRQWAAALERGRDPYAVEKAIDTLAFEPIHHWRVRHHGGPALAVHAPDTPAIRDVLLSIPGVQRSDALGVWMVPVTEHGRLRAILPALDRAADRRTP